MATNMLQLIGQLSSENNRQRSGILMSMVLSRIIEEQIVRDVMARSLDDSVNVKPSKPAATEEDIARLKRVTGKHTQAITKTDIEQTEGQCPVCFENFVEDQREVISLPCTHTYCEGCITEWLRYTRTCPLCRVEIVGVTDDGNLDPEMQQALEEEKRRTEQQRDVQESNTERESQAMQSFQNLGSALNDLLDTMSSLRQLSRVHGIATGLEESIGGIPRRVLDRETDDIEPEQGHTARLYIQENDVDGVRVISPRRLQSLSGLNGARTLSSFRNQILGNSLSSTSSSSTTPYNTTGNRLLEGLSRTSSFSSTDDIELTPVVFGAPPSSGNGNSEGGMVSSPRASALNYIRAHRDNNRSSPMSHSLTGLTSSSGSSPSSLNHFVTPSRSSLPELRSPAGSVLHPCVSGSSHQQHSSSSNSGGGGGGHNGRTILSSSTILLSNNNSNVTSPNVHPVSSSSTTTTSNDSSRRTTRTTATSLNPTVLSGTRRIGNNSSSSDNDSGNSGRGFVVMSADRLLNRNRSNRGSNNSSTPTTTTTSTTRRSIPNNNSNSSIPTPSSSSTSGNNNSGIGEGPPPSMRSASGTSNNTGGNSAEGAAPPPPPRRLNGSGETFPRAILTRNTFN